MKTGNLAIHLVNDSVKGKGYGSEAEGLIINYAFDQIGLNTVYADTVLRNKRSQHVLEKLGFKYVYEDEVFKYYELKKDNWILII
jgi:RimJ/RimL family protein N-acetyltransferase